MKDYQSKNVLCPYYRHETNRQIFCEGFTDGSHITINFDDAVEKRSHVRNFCSKYNFNHCPLAKMIYEEWLKHDG